MQCMNMEIGFLKVETIIKIGREIRIYFPNLGTLNL